ncbi:MAG: hypothetical protein QNJ12_22850 [Ilumatobacter sp.]|nr:hypothetical protein [Ilumatobacter sp.]MDJ0771643.1 hypothetical protein [Ilumatobacter sp.]
MLHRLRQTAAHCPHDQVVVVAHQAVRQGLDVEAFVNLAESTTELDPVGIAEEDRTAIDTAVHHVVNATLGINSSPSTHDQHPAYGVLQVVSDTRCDTRCDGCG